MSTSVGLVGLGTVGGQVCRRLVDRKSSLSRRTGTDVQLKAVAEPDVPEDLHDYVDKVDLYESAQDLIKNCSIDVLVELIGGMNPAEGIISNALKNGSDVVTANKELLAHSGQDLFELAREENQTIRFEASVGGCIPAVRTIREGMVDVDFSAIYGIINGTSNYVLSRMKEDGLDFDSALEVAQEKGFAEADPSYDINGTDTVHKLIILSAIAFGTPVEYDEVFRDGIQNITPEIIRDAEQLGYSIKLLGITKMTEEGIEARVHPTMIPENSALAAVENQYNAVLTQGEPVGRNMYTGKGAGGAPTATAIISDIVSLAGVDGVNQTPYLFSNNTLSTLSISEIQSRFYLRLMAKDQPGVLSRVTKILGDNQISIDSVLQVGRSDDKLVPIILTTHSAKESQMRAAVDGISHLDVIGQQPVWLHIEDEFEID